MLDDVTRLLERSAQGDSSARDLLYSRVYNELYALARHQMARVGSGHTLQPTALVHEAYLALAKTEGVSFESRTYFYALASKVMRCILIDHARARSAQKRGGAVERVSMDSEVTLSDGPSGAVDLLDLAQALEELGQIDEGLAHVVELRYLGGLPVKDLAAVLETPVRTVERRIEVAIRWLRARLDET